jgi:predicted component of type VI protein secretion system
VICRGRSFQHFDLFRKARRLRVSNPRAIEVGEEDPDLRMKVEIREAASAGVGVTEVGP